MEQYIKQFTSETEKLFQMSTNIFKNKREGDGDYRTVKYIFVYVCNANRVSNSAVLLNITVLGVDSVLGSDSMSWAQTTVE